MKRLTAAASGHRYQVEISGRGPPLALLHGFSGDASTWRPIIERLSDDLLCVAIDLLGHGGSDAPDDRASYRMEAAAVDIVDLLAQLGTGPPRLLGYSMGGRLALYLGLRYPSAFHSLILESASPGLTDAAARAARQERDGKLADAIEAFGIAAFVDHWERLPLWESQTPRQLQTQRKQRLTNSPAGLANSLRGMGAGAQPNLWGELPTLQLSVGLIVGERDDKFRGINRVMHEAMPRSRLSIIPAAGHNTHLENPEAFCRALHSFLHGFQVKPSK